MNPLAAASIVVAGIATFGAYKYSRAGLESAEFTSVSTDGDFELRDYPELTVASTPMASMDPRNSSSFGKLFRYITGENAAEEKIAMTTPVFMSGGANGRMSFVVPRDVARRGAPAAANGDVAVESIPEGRFAVLRFTGEWSEAIIGERIAELERWVANQGLIEEGAPLFAGYDPPFTPSFLRRNEVLIRVGEATP